MNKIWLYALMSIALLVRQIRLEFASELNYSHEGARYDVAEVWQAWRAGTGRHAEEGTSAKFCEWWITHYEDCLLKDGIRRTYDEFVQQLKLCASHRNGLNT